MGCSLNGAMQGPVMVSPDTAARPPFSTFRAILACVCTLLKVSMGLHEGVL